MRHSLLLPSGATVIAHYDQPLSAGDVIELYGGIFLVTEVLGSDMTAYGDTVGAVVEPVESD